MPKRRIKPSRFYLTIYEISKSSFDPRFWHQRSKVNQPRTAASNNRMISSGYGVIVSLLVSYYPLPNCLLNWLFTIIVRCYFSSWVAFLPSLPLSFIRVSLAQLSLRGKVTVQAIRPCFGAWVPTWLKKNSPFGVLYFLKPWPWNFHSVLGTAPWLENEAWLCNSSLLAPLTLSFDPTFRFGLVDETFPSKPGWHASCWTPFGSSVEFHSCVTLQWTKKIPPGSTQPKTILLKNLLWNVQSGILNQWVLTSTLETPMRVLLYFDFLANDFLERFVQVHTYLMTRLLIIRVPLVQLLPLQLSIFLRCLFLLSRVCIPGFPSPSLLTWLAWHDMINSGAYLQSVVLPLFEVDSFLECEIRFLIQSDPLAELSIQYAPSFVNSVVLTSLTYQ